MTTPCGNHSDCNNTVGSYTCLCRAGYRKDDDGKCEGRTHTINTQINNYHLETVLRNCIKTLSLVIS